MIKYNEDEKFFKEDSPFSPLGMPKIRRVFPQLLANQVVGVVPTSEPQRNIICP